MSRSTLTNDVSHNVAKGNSSQNNSDWEWKGSRNREGKYFFHKVRIYCIFELAWNNLISANIGAVKQYLGVVDVPEFMDTPKSPFCQHNNKCLPRSDLFKREFKTYSIHNRERWSESVLCNLTDDHFDVVKEWMGARDSQTLLVVSTNGWTTNLLRDVMHSVQEHPEARRTILFAAHLCGHDIDKKRGRQEFILVQDLLGQLFEVCRDTLNAERMCLQPELEVQDLKAMDVGIDRLWKLFTDNTKRTEIKKLVIVLDRIDEVHVYATNKAFSEFVARLETVRNTLGDGGIAVKLMITRWKV
ncbi:hypothetical protein M426DRAFT_265584 [Hypoxylon sp. CI-4A]|nr:hypothetical protein M426DRAFT_265584 [Hypoxylon sp. CI-4A]